MTPKVLLILSFHFLFSFASAAELCHSYLNPKHEQHYLHSGLLNLSPELVPLDSMFYQKNGTPKILQKPFVWQIKNQSGQTVGAYIGTSHSYISLEMMPPQVVDLIRQADMVMTEYSSQQNGELDAQLILPESDRYGVRIVDQLTKAEVAKALRDWLNFLTIKEQAVRRLGRAMFFPSHSFSINQISAYGFFTQLSLNAEIASSELRAQPIQLDDQIANLAQFYGAKWQFLEEGPVFLENFAFGYTLARVKELLAQQGNIFEIEYFRLKQFFEQYLNGDLAAFAQYVDELNDHEHKHFFELRNKSWMPRIINNLQYQKFTVIAAGAFHFVGRDNLIQLLEDAGYTVERLHLD